MSVVATAPATFSRLLQDFFTRYLPIERNLSHNTTLSYRDAIKLLLRFLCSTEGKAPEALTCEEVLDAERVRGFLRWLAEDRRCKPSTRNQRLAALKCFARYVSWRAPEYLDLCRRVREIPRARTEAREPEYLDSKELSALLKVPAPSSVVGLRDRALLLLLYNTGARVQEMCDLNVTSLRLAEVPCVRILGKGNKERVCPLWTKTVSAFEAYLRCRPNAHDGSPLFLSARGRRLGRSGLSYVLSRVAIKAGLKAPKHARRLTPHVIRHSTAMHLLEAGVDLTVIASWLGHAQLSTTHGYLAINLRMKLDAVAGEALIPELRGGAFPAPDVISWLEKLGGRASYVESSPPKVSPELSSAHHSA